MLQDNIINYQQSHNSDTNSKWTCIEDYKLLIINQKTLKIDSVEKPFKEKGMTFKKDFFPGSSKCPNSVFVFTVTAW